MFEHLRYNACANNFEFVTHLVGFVHELVDIFQTIPRLDLLLENNTSVKIQ